MYLLCDGGGVLLTFEYEELFSIGKSKFALEISTLKKFLVLRAGEEFEDLLLILYCCIFFIRLSGI
jgi:hypothetical protein